MESTSPFDESAVYLRHGFKVAIAALILCAGALLAQDVLPGVTCVAMSPATTIPDMRDGPRAIPGDQVTSPLAWRAPYL